MISLSYRSCISSLTLPFTTVSDPVANEKILNNNIVYVAFVATTSKKVIFNPSTPTQQFKAFLLYCHLTFANVKSSVHFLFVLLEDNFMTKPPAATVVLQHLLAHYIAIISMILKWKIFNKIIKTSD